MLCMGIWPCVVLRALGPVTEVQGKLHFQED